MTYLTRALAALAIWASCAVLAKAQYWQQRADYDIVVDLDTVTHRYAGTQQIRYTNNSPDTLRRFFLHLYPNAFQPGSMMDVRSRTIADPDRRVGDRISKLAPAEQGYLHVTGFRQNGEEVAVVEEGTVAVIDLARPLLPGGEMTLDLEFDGQVPLQVRRSGRDNAEGVDYSMSQWYPKVVEYDHMGWHANPYVGREFHGVWGDFDVTVILPKGQVFAATGYARDPDLAGLPKGVRRAVRRGERVAHRRVAPNVHDFTWAADTRFEEIVRERADGTRLEFYYLPGEKTTENWRALPAIMDRAFDFVNRNYGQYPYDKYAFVQGGDGGMEYAMMTLITGERSLRSLVGVSVHELMHSWYQFVLATNESLYPWMDEGFTSFGSAEVMAHLTAEGVLPGEGAANPHEGTVMGYARFANSGRAEPLSTHADHYATNAAYGVGSYVKGELFLYQLRSLIGEAAFRRTLLRYYDEWKFRHPTPNDFVRIAEKESGQELDWYLQYMTNSTAQIDYAVDGVTGAGRQSVISLSRPGGMPFPITVAVTDVDGRTVRYHVPLRIQRGHRPLAGDELAADWPWTNPTYELVVPLAADAIAEVVVDPDLEMSEADKTNNVYPRRAAEEGEGG